MCDENVTICLTKWTIAIGAESGPTENSLTPVSSHNAISASVRGPVTHA